MNIFVIEDEPPILREIVSTIKSLDSEYIVIDTAQNGKDAIDKINKLYNEIDIIITDINLPILSGLDIIEYTKAQYPDILCIVLSGYNDFSFAQKALQLSVLDYILKPVDADELDKVLKNAWEHKCVKNFAPKVVSRTQSAPATSYYLAILCVDSHVWDKSLISDDVQSAIYYSNHFQQALDSILTDHNFWLIDGSFSREKFLMLSLDDDSLVTTSFQRIYTHLLLPGHSLSMIVHATPIGIDSVNPNCQMLREEVRQTLVLQESQLLFTPCDKYLYNSHYYYNEISRLSTLFESGNFSYFLTGLKELIYQFKDHSLPLYRVIELIKLLIGNCHNTAIGKDVNWDQPSSVSSDIFTYSFTYDDLFTNIKSMFELLFHESQSSSNESKDALLMKLDLYIQAHYREPINTQSLCSIFNFTPAYISKLYKDYKGITPSSYITQLRMAEAQKLLTESNMNVRDLSLYLGYEDPFYFSKLFKKLYGVSPKQYQMNANRE